MDGQAQATVAASRLHRIALWTGALATALAAFVLIRWFVGDRGFVGLLDGLPQMKPNSAFAFLLAGLALIAAIGPNFTAARRGFVLLVGLVLSLMAALTLLEYIFGSNLGVDTVLPVTAVNGSHPGRPSAHTAAAMLPLGIWLLTLLSERGFAVAVRNVSAICVSVVLAETAIGYIYGVSEVAALNRETGMPITTLIAFLLMFVGLSCARPETGLTEVLIDQGSGGYMARRVALGILLIPFVIGLVLALLARTNAIAGIDNVAISTATTMVVGMLVMVLMAERLTEYDRTRQELTERLRDLSERDPMTGAYNRRKFDQELAAAVESAHADGKPLALVLIDVDKLKQVNDNDGHAAGDRLICGVADVIKQSFRTSDAVARIGGDEFAVVLPGAEATVAERLVDALLATLADSSWSLGDVAIDPSASIGVAVASGAQADPGLLLQTADEALYEIKRGGGGAARVVEISGGAQSGVNAGLQS